METGRILSLKKPITYNEKIQWLKLNDRNIKYSYWSDKYLVRSYIEKSLGKEFLIPIIGVYNSISEIDFQTLPDKFVIKVSNGSGTNIVCQSRGDLNIYEVNKKLKKWLKRDGSRFGREWVYKINKPKIVIEKFMSNKDGSPIKDFKFMCFNGKVKLIQLHSDRYGNHTNDFYTREWVKTKIKQGVPNSSYKEPKPKMLKEMIDIAELLSRDLPYMRVDLYNVEGKILFGEITMYPTSGFCLFENDHDDVILGNWINLKQ